MAKHRFEKYTWPNTVQYPIKPHISRIRNLATKLGIVSAVSISLLSVSSNAYAANAECIQFRDGTDRDEMANIAASHMSRDGQSQSLISAALSKNSYLINEPLIQIFIAINSAERGGILMSLGFLELSQHQAIRLNYCNATDYIAISQMLRIAVVEDLMSDRPRQKQEQFQAWTMSLYPEENLTLDKDQNGLCSVALNQLVTKLFPELPKFKCEIGE